MESKVILTKRRLFVCFLLILLLQTVYAAYELSQTDIERQEDYPQLYRDNIDRVFAQAEEMQTVSIFADKSAFSSHNIAKTVADYQRIADIEPTVFQSVGLSAFLSLDYIHIWAAFLLVLVALGHIPFPQKGFRMVMHTCRNGRNRQSVRRLLSLALWSFVVIVFVYGADLVLSVCICRTPLASVLSAPAQSIPELVDFTFPMSIGGFLLWYMAVRWLIAYVLSLTVWLMFFLFSNMLLATGSATALGLVQLLCALRINENSPLAAARYCSFFYLFRDNSFFQEYRNIILFDSVYGKIGTVLLAAGITVLAVWIIVLAKTAFLYPSEHSGAIYASRRLDAAVTRRLSLNGFEVYKLLVRRKGVILIAFLVFFLVRETNMREVTFTDSQRQYMDFIEKYGGVPTEESDRWIEDLGKEIEEIEDEYARTAEGYENGEIDSDTYYYMMMLYDTYGGTREFYSKIQEQRDYLTELSDTKGIEGWYVNELSYHQLLREGQVVRTAALVLLELILVFALFWEEKQAGMYTLLRSCPNGRSDLERRKQTMVICIVWLLFLFKHLLEYVTVQSNFGIDGLGAPAQSLAIWSWIPIPCSLGMILAARLLAESLLLAVTEVGCFQLFKKTKWNR